MAEASAARITTLRMLLPGPAEIARVASSSPAEDADVLHALADLYAYPEPTPSAGWVRASMVSTLDGSATGDDGLSGGIGGPADRAVLAVLRGLADVVLVGAGTARAEGYQVPQAKPAFADRRRRAGQRPAVQLALVTRSGDIPERALAADSGYVITCAGADVAGLRRRFGQDRVLIAGLDDVEVGEAVAALAARGLPRVLLEGGPSLLGRALAADMVHELCLTLSALAVAGDGPRIAVGPPAHRELTLTHLLQSDNLLLGRWLVRRDHRPTG